MKIIVVLLVLSVVVANDCQKCIDQLHKLKKAKNTSICDEDSSEDFSCFKLYYYLFYFSPNYFFSDTNKQAEDCEICSYLEKCEISKCSQVSLPNKQFKFLESKEPSNQLIQSHVNILVEKVSELAEMVDKAQNLVNKGYNMKKEFIKLFVMIKSSPSLERILDLKNKESSFSIHTNTKEALILKENITKAADFLKTGKIDKNMINKVRNLVGKVKDFMKKVISFCYIPFQLVKKGFERKKVENTETNGNNSLGIVLQKLNEIQQRQARMELEVKKQIEELKRNSKINHKEEINSLVNKASLRDILEKRQIKPIEKKETTKIEVKNKETVKKAEEKHKVEINKAPKSEKKEVKQPKEGKKSENKEKAPVPPKIELKKPEQSKEKLGKTSIPSKIELDKDKKKENKVAKTEDKKADNGSDKAVLAKNAASSAISSPVSTKRGAKTKESVPSFDILADMLSKQFDKPKETKPKPQVSLIDPLPDKNKDDEFKPPLIEEESTIIRHRKRDYISDKVVIGDIPVKHHHKRHSKHFNQPHEQEYKLIQTQEQYTPKRQVNQEPSKNTKESDLTEHSITQENPNPPVDLPEHDPVWDKTIEEAEKLLSNGYNY